MDKSEDQNIPPETKEPTEKQHSENQPPEEKPPAADPILPEEKEIAGADDHIEEIARSLEDAKPEKQDHFVKATQEKRTIEQDQKTAAEAGQDWRFLKDSSGCYWHPDYCENKADPKTGIPPKTARGFWKLKRSAKASDRKKLPKRPPNIQQKVDNADAAEQVQASAEAEAAAIQQKAILTTKAILAGHSAIMSQVSGEKAVKEVMNYEIGQGQFKVKVYDLIEASGVEMMIKRGGGPRLSPEAIFFGGLLTTTGVIVFHPDRPERRQSFWEWVGIRWHRLKGWLSGKRTAEKPEQEKEQGAQE